MVGKNIILTILGFILTLGSLRAQVESLRPYDGDDNRTNKLKELASQFEKQFILDQKEAKMKAEEWGIPVRFKDGDQVFQLMRISFGMPVYYATTNATAAKTVGVDKLFSDAGLGYDLDGKGMTVGEWDGGGVRTTHQEFDERVILKDVPFEDNDNHATHVAGTMVASGVETEAKGMAPKATLHGYDWANDDAEMATEAGNGLILSNHSYGNLQGWRKTDTAWIWYGNPNISDTTDYRFGFYSNSTRAWDQIAFNAPHYLIVKSAGNDRSNDGPDPGEDHYYFDFGSYVKSSIERNSDGPWDCIITKSVAKNILTVGAVRDISNGYSKPSDVRLTDFSSTGPVDDGRIKPDLVANGHRLYSTRGTGDDDYYRSRGTSMSAPNTTGALVLIQEHYSELNAGNFLSAAGLKALALATCDEAGSNDGPDYEYGWGLLNAYRAVQYIDDNEAEVIIRENKLLNNGSYSLDVKASGNEPLKATIVWTDPAADAEAPALNPRTPKLVNDLDLRIVRKSDDSTALPWKLDPLNPEAAATTGDNIVDNVEQVLIKNPSPGDYSIQINHKGSLENGEQNFAIVISGLEVDQNASYCSDTVRLSSNFGNISDGSGNNRYGHNADCYWLIEPENGNNVTLTFKEFETESNADYVRVYDGSSTNDPLLGEFSGNQIPGQIQSTDGQMLIHFTSNATINPDGWSAQYTTFNPNACNEARYLNYQIANNVDAGYLWRINENYLYEPNPGFNLLTEVGFSLLDFVNDNGSVFSPQTPFNLDSFSIEITHENNSGQEDTFIAYIQETDANGYPNGAVIWSDTLYSNQSISPSGKWSGSNSQAFITYYPELQLSGKFMIGYQYFGALEDTSSIVAYFENIGSGPNDIRAENADYLESYKRLVTYDNNNWAPDANGDDYFRDLNQDGIENADEANFIQVYSIETYISEPYELEKPEITANDATTFCEGETLKLSGPTGFDSYTWNNGLKTREITVNESGNYSVTVSDENNCLASSNEVKVTVIDAPEKPEISRDYDSLFAPMATAYQWKRNGVEIPEATEQKYVPTLNDDYSVIVFNDAGCSNESDTIGFIFTGIEDEVLDDLKIYPNPVENKLQLDLSSLEASSMLEYVIFNSAGKQVLRDELKGSQINSIDVQKLKAGQYLIQIKEGEQAATMKFIKR